MGPGDPFATVSRDRGADAKVESPELPPMAEPVWSQRKEPDLVTPPGFQSRANVPDSLEDRRIGMQSSSTMGALVAIVGLVTGLVFGVVSLLASPWGALLVLLFGAIGALLGGGTYVIATGRVDVVGAWRVFWRR